MHDFSCAEPDRMYYHELAERTRFFKESKEGVVTMCKILEEVVEETKRETEKETKRQTMFDTAKRMLSFGKYTLDEIANISGLPLDEVRKLQKA